MSSKYDPDRLSPNEAAESHASIRRGLKAVAEGRVMPLKEWAEKVRREFKLPTDLSDEDLFGDAKQHR